MKRIIAGILVVVIVSSLAGCCCCIGRNSKFQEIDEKIQGVWVCSGTAYTTRYTFEDGQYTRFLVNMLGEHTYQGEYTIKEDGIYCGDASGDPTITYSYDERTGNLRMWDFYGNPLSFYSGLSSY